MIHISIKMWSYDSFPRLHQLAQVWKKGLQVAPSNKDIKAFGKRQFNHVIFSSYGLSFFFFLKKNSMEVLLLLLLLLLFYIIGNELFEPMTSLKSLTTRPILVTFYFFIYVD